MCVCVRERECERARQYVCLRTSESEILCICEKERESEIDR